MTQEEMNKLFDKNMPDWLKDQIHNEQEKQAIFDAGYAVGYKKAKEELSNENN